MVKLQQACSDTKTGKRLRLIPLILGCYGAFLGFGLVAIGLSVDGIFR